MGLNFYDDLTINLILTDVHTHAQYNQLYNILLCQLLNFILDELATAWLQMLDDVMFGSGEPTYSALASALDERDRAQHCRC